MYELNTDKIDFRHRESLLKAYLDGEDYFEVVSFFGIAKGAEYSIVRTCNERVR